MRLPHLPMATIAFLLACPFAVAADAEDAGAIKLFDGKSLAGWECFTVDPEAKIDDVWRVEDGLLITTGQPLGYLATKEKFTNFRLIVEWRWPEGQEPGNSGVLLRTADKPITFLTKCMEAQLKGGSAGEVYGFYGFKADGPEDRFYEVKDHAAIGSFVGLKRIRDAEKPVGQWNRYEITLDGGRMTLELNGQLVNEASACEVVAGRIGLQSEGGEIQFRTVTLIPKK